MLNFTNKDFWMKKIICCWYSNLNNWILNLIYTMLLTIFLLFSHFSCTFLHYWFDVMDIVMKWDSILVLMLLLVKVDETKFDHSGAHLWCVCTSYAAGHWCEFFCINSCIENHLHQNSILLPWLGSWEDCKVGMNFSQLSRWIGLL